MDDLMFMEDVTAMLGISKPTLMKWHLSGKLPAARLPGSRKLFWFKSSIIEALKEGEGRRLKYNKG